MREIVLDTETTGLSPEAGHKVVEIGCVELLNRLPTGKVFHHYINPERDVDQGAARVHGLTLEKLANQPTFREVAENFLEFIADSPIVAHNAGFDMAFINAELKQADRAPLENSVIDTLALARTKLPGSKHSLDALCLRYAIDITGRTLHGALLDARLLADVYLELTGGLQGSLLPTLEEKIITTHTSPLRPANAQTIPARVFEIPPDELAAHTAAIAKIKEAIWTKI